MNVHEAKGAVRLPADLPADAVGRLIGGDLVTVAPAAALPDVAAVMACGRLSAVLVVADGMPVGIVTERDILKAWRRRLDPATPAEAVMGRPVVSCAADCDYREAYRLLNSKRIHHLAVVDAAGCAVGLVSDGAFRANLDMDADAAQTRVAAAMTPDPVAIPLTADMETAVVLMERAAVTAAVVVENGEPWGIVTARDVVREFAAGGATRPVTEVMTAPVVTVGENETLADALALMRRRHIRRLVVTDAAGRLAGLLSQSDLVAHLDANFREFAEQRRDRARLAYREAQARLRAIYDGSPYFIGLLDLDGLLLDANATALAAIDKPLGELIGRPFWATPWWSHDVALQARLRDAVARAAAGESQRFEACQTTASGRTVWVDFSLHPVPDASGRIAWLLPQGVDITERKGAEEELRTLKRAVEHSNASIVITDEQGTIRYVNPRFCQLSGYGRGEAVGQNPRFLKSGRVGDAVYRELWQTITAGQPWQGRLCNRKKNGDLYWEDTVISPVRDDSGRISHYVAVKEDITDKRAAEERLKLAASVYSSSHDGILITDPAGFVVDVNTAFERITGYSRSELVGNKASMLNSGQHDSFFFSHMWETIAREGIWRGEITNRRKDGSLLVEVLTISAVRDDDGQVSHYVGAFTDITELKKSQERLAFLAHFDALTGLPNRSLLTDRLSQAAERARRAETLLAVAYVDLDGFTPINESHGHQAGDRVLVEVAGRLTDALRGVDTVARIGGDEFVLLLPDIQLLGELETLLERILATIAVPLGAVGDAQALGASIGVTLYPLDGGDPETLLRHANQAMFAAKQAGGNQFHLFDADQDKRSRNHRDMAGRVREALVRNEFELWYQPKVNLRFGRVEGAEALLRWCHPERGILAPGEFLPYVEDSDFMVDLGNWVLEQAARQVESWLDKGIEVAVSVNIAARHLQRPDFVERLGELLARHPRLPPGLLEIEILETAALEDMAFVTRLIEDCRRIGIDFALDDFGTGYASLAYFRQLPARTLKIDQGFVRNMLDDPGDLAIVEAVIGLTAAFQRSVIAEGVETAEHGNLLLELGCDLAQGYGIARPMPPADFETWLSGFAPDPGWAIAASRRLGRDAFAVVAASMHLRRWVARLVAGEMDDLDLGMVGDICACEFGRWYENAGAEHLGNLDMYCEIGPLHRQLHELAVRFVAARRAGQADEAEGLRRRLAALRDDLLARLFALRELLVQPLRHGG